MSQSFSIERTLRTIHGWLGALILPWIFMAGMTGYYMNHEKFVMSFFPEKTATSGELFLTVRGAGPVSLSDSKKIASDFDLGMKYAPNDTKKFRGTSIYRFKAGSHNTIYVDKSSGGYWHLKRYKIIAYDRMGAQLGSELRWGRIFNSIHERGFVGESLGRWLADMTAIALMIFSASGIFIFVSPRMRRAKNRRARRSAVRF